jgi:hypothetical protein
LLGNSNIIGNPIKFVNHLGKCASNNLLAVSSSAQLNVKVTSEAKDCSSKVFWFVRI